MANGLYCMCVRCVCLVSIRKLDNIIDNVIDAPSAPTVDASLLAEAVPSGVAVSPGDTRTGPQTYAARVLDATELERRDAPGRLRQALALLAAWQDDALSAAELGAITAAQRIARQAQTEAQTETRTAALARIVRRLLITHGLDQ